MPKLIIWKRYLWHSSPKMSKMFGHKVIDEIGLEHLSSTTILFQIWISGNKGDVIPFFVFWGITLLIGYEFPFKNESWLYDIDEHLKIIFESNEFSSIFLESNSLFGSLFNSTNENGPLWNKNLTFSRQFRFILMSLIFVCSIEV